MACETFFNLFEFLFPCVKYAINVKCLSVYLIWEIGENITKGQILSLIKWEMSPFSMGGPAEFCQWLCHGVVPGMVGASGM